MANVKAAVKKAASAAAEAKPTLGDANDALQALKDKMDGKITKAKTKAEPKAKAKPKTEPKAEPKAEKE